MARNTDRFMERQHERRMEQQGQGSSARALRRAQEAEQRRAQERAEREAQREAGRATGFNSGGTVTGRLSGMDRAIRYAQMYSAGPEPLRRMAEQRSEYSIRASDITAGTINHGDLISEVDIEQARRRIYETMNQMLAVGALGNPRVMGVDLGRDPNAGLSLTEEDRVYHRERSRIIHEIMDARYMRGRSGEAFEDTIVRLARELVALEDDHIRAEAQKQRRSALDVARRLGLEDEAGAA